MDLWTGNSALSARLRVPYRSRNAFFALACVLEPSLPLLRSMHVAMRRSSADLTGVSVLGIFISGNQSPLLEGKPLTWPIR